MIRRFFTEAGYVSRFLFQVIREFFTRDYEWKEFLKQCFYVGNLSLPLAGTTAFIIGLVLTLQSQPTLQDFGAETMLPAMVSVSIVREIGPVIMALIFAGKVGSGIGAELGSMRVTEQIDAMEASGVSPVKYLVSTRVLATTLMLPVITIVGNAIALFGSYIAVNMHGTVSMRLYVTEVFDSVEYSDVIPSLIKSYFFGFAIGFAGCYKGYFSNRGTEGVGRAANEAVVVASLLIFIIDLVTVQVLQMLNII